LWSNRPKRILIPGVNRARNLFCNFINEQMEYYSIWQECHTTDKKVLPWKEHMPMTRAFHCAMQNNVTSSKKIKPWREHQDSKTIMLRVPMTRISSNYKYTLSIDKRAIPQKEHFARGKTLPRQEYHTMIQGSHNGKNTKERF